MGLLYFKCIAEVPFDVIDSFGFCSVSGCSNQDKIIKAMCHSSAIVHLVQGGIFNDVPGRKE